MNKSQILSFKTNGYVVLRKYLNKKKIKILRKEVDSISKKFLIKNIFDKKKNIFWKKNFKKLNQIRLELNYNNNLFKKFFHTKKFLNDTSKLKSNVSRKFEIDKVRFNIPTFKNKLHPWHQDEITWPNKVNQKPLTFWIPLVDVNEDNGIEFAKLDKKSKNLFTHKLGKNPKTKLKFASLVNKKLFYKTFKPKLRVGDVIIFDAFVPHRSCLNKTQKIRISIDTRFK